MLYIYASRILHIFTLQNLFDCTHDICNYIHQIVLCIVNVFSVIVHFMRCLEVNFTVFYNSISDDGLCFLLDSGNVNLLSGTVF